MLKLLLQAVVSILIIPPQVVCKQITSKTLAMFVKGLVMAIFARNVLTERVMSSFYIEATRYLAVQHVAYHLFAMEYLQK